MTDQKFLWWLHERLTKVHGEREMLDYMHRFRAIIADMPPEQEASDVARTDTMPDVLWQRLTK